MPNYCSTTYWITGDQDEIKVLADAFKKAKANAVIETEFGKGWLGHLLTHIGYSEEQIKHGCIRCRGHIYGMLVRPDVITLDVLSAWSPQHEPIKLMCAKYAPDAVVEYLSTEPGCDVYLTNHPDYMDKFLIDTHGEGPDSLEKVDGEYLGTTDLTRVLKAALGEDGDYESLIEKATERWEDLSIHPVQYSEL